MYNWHTSTFTVILTFIFGSVNAAPFVCGQDLNNDGILTGVGETATCLSTSGGELCPISAIACTTTEICPLSSNVGCVSGSCSVTSTQNYDLTSNSGGLFGSIPVTVVTSFNAITSAVVAVKYSSATCTYGTDWGWSGNQLWANNGCAAQFVVTGSTAATCTTSPPSCPLGSAPCLDTGGGNFQCSMNACVDQALAAPVATAIDSRVYADDGARDSTGICMDQIMIFSGRAMECRTAGIDTAYQTCCKNFGRVVSDSTGSISEAVNYGKAISGAWEVASAAYTAYSATGSSAVAASAASDAALVAFDPYSLAIAIVVALVLDYLQNSCDQMDMETGMLNSSGYCYPTGSYCKKDWPLAGCVQEANTFCCFKSKLARIIHEQGRPQLKSFNTVPANNCRGFTPEEFQYLDFSQIDLSEYYHDLKTAPASLMEGNIKNGIQTYYDAIR